MKSHFNIKLAMTDTPETDECVKNNKHIKFLEEDHWSLNGKFTYTHPIVALCRKLERERDEEREHLKEIEEYGTEEINAAVELRQKLATALVERDDAREQRDRLAEALERIANNNIQDSPETNYAYQFGRMEGIAKTAIQSLTTNNQNGH
jgi:ribosome-binding ATPase YchF (GTP1/OBG family)